MKFTLRLGSFLGLLLLLNSTGLSPSLEGLCSIDNLSSGVKGSLSIKEKTSLKNVASLDLMIVLAPIPFTSDLITGNI